MGEQTAISWTDATWNPWRGCDKVSPGCAHCYAEREYARYKLGPFDVVTRCSPTTFRAPLKWREPRLVFTCSWSDWFHPAADEWREEAWDIIRRTPQHTYQILTKRPEQMMGTGVPWGPSGDPWPNVWLGVSIENERFTNRASILRTIPAAVRFLSLEPLLGPLRVPFGMDWVIVGGESGPDFRPMDLDWLRSVVEQCRAEGVPVWVKQDAGLLSGRRGRIPEDLWIQERPRMQQGR
jgi:protein gp37